MGWVLTKPRHKIIIFLRGYYLQRGLCQYVNKLELKSNALKIIQPQMQYLLNIRSLANFS